MVRNFFLDLRTWILTRNPVAWVIILFITTLILFAFSFLREPTSSPSVPTPTPTAKSQAPSTQAKFDYPDDKIDRMLQLVEERTPLRDTDQSIRNRLIASLGGDSGILYDSEKFTIEYVKAPDSFMVAVKSTDIENSKRDATAWFKEQGVSIDGICHFPIIFYPDMPQDQIPDKTLTFNPLAEGC